MDSTPTHPRGSIDPPPAPAIGPDPTSAPNNAQPHDPSPAPDPSHFPITGGGHIIRLTGPTDGPGSSRSPRPQRRRPRIGSPAVADTSTPTPSSPYTSSTSSPGTNSPRRTAGSHTSTRMHHPLPSYAATRTMTITETERDDEAGDAPTRTDAVIGTLFLRADRSPSSTRRIQWADGVIDNEGLGRKSSKVCCIFHPAHTTEASSGSEDGSGSSSSSSESDSDDYTSDSESGACSHHHNHNHSHNHGSDHNPRRRYRPNAYERQPKIKRRPPPGGVGDGRPEGPGPDKGKETVRRGS